ncbi:hypothetical protein E1A91_D05G007200v1 [Gossypium mustelinum]|uniref:Uncharacterized protein n=1 Tax=Gossypium mustelinum TaxID=34275 RepID=A0A5D2UNE7_GOSMU|nr:hypothetical protein E1A91_D05G007200v1 [Gossypium mustelinum]
MAGVGKTTLAKAIYQTSEQKFKNRAWIFVPSKYRMRELLLGLLENLMSVGEETLKLDDVKLAEKLRKLLLGKRYLVVIDGVEKAQLWQEFEKNKVFPDHQDGSRVLLTTCSNGVALLASSSPIRTHHLQSLGGKERSELLEKLVFKDGSCPEHLVNKLQPSVMSSHLPLSLWLHTDHLKECFLYLGAYPSDCEIPARQIINLWIAEVLAKGNNEASAELIAERYLDELIDLCLIEDHIHELRYILSDPIYLSHLHSLLCFHNNGSLDSDEFTLKFDHLPNISALDLGSTINHPSLKRLPSSLCNLSDQQTLDIKNTCVKRLQCGIWEMQKLRHLSKQKVINCAVFPIAGTFPTRLVKVTLVRTDLVSDDVMRTLEKLDSLNGRNFIQTWRMGDGAMGSLEEFTLCRCHELKSLPHQLWQLHDMHQIKVNSPSHCLKRELEQLRAEQRKVHIHF